MATLKVLVVGRSGMLARCLADLGIPEVAIENVGRPDLDLRDEDSIARSIERARPDIVINAAGYTAVDQAESDEAAAFALNANGPARLASVASRFGVPLIHVSTDYVFDGRKAAPYDEADACHPLGVYGRSKVAGERMVAETHPQHLILRTSWLHASIGANFVHTILRLAATKPEIRVVDDQLGSPTYAPHLAAALIAVAQAAVKRGGAGLGPWGVYHAAGSGETTWFGLAGEILKNAADYDLPLPALRAIRTADYPTKAVRPANSRLDSSRLAATFGVRLPDWRIGVADCVSKIATADPAPVRSNALASAGETQ